MGYLWFLAEYYDCLPNVSSRLAWHHHAYGQSILPFQLGSNIMKTEMIEYDELPCHCFFPKTRFPAVESADLKS